MRVQHLSMKDLTELFSLAHLLSLYFPISSSSRRLSSKWFTKKTVAQSDAEALQILFSSILAARELTMKPSVRLANYIRLAVRSSKAKPTKYWQSIRGRTAYKSKNKCNVQERQISSRQKLRTDRAAGSGDQVHVCRGVRLVFLYLAFFSYSRAQTQSRVGQILTWFCNMIHRQYL